MSSNDEALKRIMRLEVALLLLVSAMRNEGGAPKELLDSVESIVTKG